MHGATEQVTSITGPLTASEPYLWGRRLFQPGYYWEAHEAWEGLWHALGRSGPRADLVKGLIKLAAAGVKLREHNRDGLHRHLARAEELTTQARAGAIGYRGSDLRRTRGELRPLDPVERAAISPRPIRAASRALPSTFVVLRARCVLPRPSVSSNLRRNSDFPIDKQKPATANYCHQTRRIFATIPTMRGPS